jgi:hypothetical protein
MDKAEAIAVLHEIFKVCPEFRHADFVSLDPNNIRPNTKAIIKLGCEQT